MMPQALADYNRAYELYKAKDYTAALRGLEVMEEYIAHWPKLNLLKAQVFFEQGRYVSVLDALTKGLRELAEDERSEYAAEFYSRLGSAYYRLGRCREAVEAFLMASRAEKNLTARRQECSNAIFAASSVGTYQAADYRRLYREYNALLSDIEPYPTVFYRHDKLRVGYLSPDFKMHPLAHFLYPLLRFHDRKNFRLYAYTLNPPATWDTITHKLLAETEEQRDLSALSDEAAAAKIREDEPDILFDLTGHTLGNRLAILAYHPATLQITGLGDVNTTGTKVLDYYWSDNHADSPLAQDYVTETLGRSLKSFVCYAPQGQMPEPSPAPFAANGYITFGTFNNFSKVTDEMLMAWNFLLTLVPRSKLLLKHRLFDSDEGREYTLARLSGLGYDLSRVEIRGFSRNYLPEYALMDVALDTYPYTGGVTTCEALYMGVPVVSLYGHRPGSNVGRSILDNVGLSKLAGASFTEYIKIAAELASSTQFLTAMRQNLRPQMQNSRLMDGADYMAEVEDFYRQIWFMAKVKKGT
ncbi:MAG: hypothetical protein IJ849_06850 [Selenomonadaceae bacterium]|nr:hypothetical protein [Selenomonadaceae bacterium]